MSKHLRCTTDRRHGSRIVAGRRLARQGARRPARKRSARARPRSVRPGRPRPSSPGTTSPRPVTTAHPSTCSAGVGEPAPSLSLRARDSHGSRRLARADLSARSAPPDGPDRRHNDADCRVAGPWVHRKVLGQVTHGYARARMRCCNDRAECSRGSSISHRPGQEWWRLTLQWSPAEYSAGI